MIDRLHRKEQPIREFGVGEAVVEQAQHVDLACGQPRRVGQRRCASARRYDGRPPARRSRRTFAATASAPSRSRMSRARAASTGSALSSSASAASYGIESRWNSSAAASYAPSSTTGTARRRRSASTVPRPAAARPPTRRATTPGPRPGHPRAAPALGQCVRRNCLSARHLDDCRRDGQHPDRLAESARELPGLVERRRRPRAYAVPPTRE